MALRLSVMNKAYILSALLILFPLLSVVEGHGRLWDPPGRSSLWRFKKMNDLIRNSPFADKIQPNYSDNQIFCGGSSVQKMNGGRCGVCGDNWQDSQPRQNEAGGKYGLGIISREYETGSWITVKVDITAQHKGYFEFRLCKLDNRGEIATEDCMNQNLLMTEKGTRYTEINHTGMYNVKVKLPGELTCTQCVMQWKYKTGNSWGCEGADCGLGYGHQEHFYGCADIAIGDDIGEGSTQVPTPTTSTSPPSTMGTTTTRSTTKWTPPPATTTTTVATASQPSVSTTSPARRPTMQDCEGKGYGQNYKWNCEMFFMCLPGYPFPIVQTCPPGTVYDGRICNYPNSVPECIKK